MDSSTVLKILQNHLPEPSVRYSYELWLRHPFSLKITKGRHTKVGDFSCQPEGKHPTITLNNNLNPYLFLITYIHEVAHWCVYIKYRDSVAPHGSNWKNAFKYLLGPLLKDSVFPHPLLELLRKHMTNPKASSFADTGLTSALRAFDRNAVLQVTLSQIQEGSVFLFHKRYFRKGKLRRTRFVCKEMKTRREYLVPSDAVVEEAQMDLF
jgi:hypothetical protein